MSMLKKLVILLLCLSVLCSCKKEKEIINHDYSDLAIVSPTGAPSLAFLCDIDNPNFETNGNASNIVAMMNSNSDKEVVVIDTISGIKAINNGAPYKLAANLTFGNFYLAASGNDDNGVMDKDDVIVVFGEGITPDIIFHYLYSDEFDENIEYVNTVSDAGKCLAAGINYETGNDVDYVLIAQPILENILNNVNAPTYGKASVYQNIQESYKEKSGMEMIQASLFIKNDDYIADKDDYLNYLKNNIDKVLSDSDYVSSLLNGRDKEEVSAIYGIAPDLIDCVVKDNLVGLGFKRAYDNKQAIDEFVSLFGLDETSEEIYLK